MNRRTAIRRLATFFLTTASLAHAQQPKKVPRIGYLSPLEPASDFARVEAIRLALRERGYIEGQNIATEYRYAEGKPDRYPELLAELVRLKVDIIVVAGGDRSIRAAKNATKTIPIVMVGAGSDPVEAGFVESLARPGGNVTGLSLLATELSAKRLEILKASLPGLARVAVLWNPGNASVHLKVKETVSAARLLGLQLQSLEARVPGDLETQIKAAARARADALVTADDQFLSSQRVQVVGLAMQHRLPVVSEFREFVEAGALCSYGPSLTDLARRTATYVDRILKGAKPANLPVEEPTKFELLINLKTARALGLTIPQSVIVRADEIID
jgi:putative ABC transport system substrate-binding protein